MVTEPSTFTDSLEALDFLPQCLCGSDCGHGPDCDMPASVFVVVHRVDDCNEPDCDADGNSSAIICHPCYVHCLQLAAQFIRHATQLGRAACLTCGAPMGRLDDVIRDARSL